MFPVILGLVSLTALLVPSLAFAEDAPPTPRPRPDRPEYVGPFVFIPSRPTELVLSGMIEDEAPAILQRVLRAAPTIQTLRLASDGGYVDPALLIAKEVRRRGLATHIPAGQQCSSACAFVFLAGVSRTADGQLGVHQISGTDDPTSVQLTLSDIFLELRQFGTPDAVVADMLKTRPEDMRYYSPSELADLGLIAGGKAPREERYAQQQTLADETRETAPPASADAPQLPEKPVAVPDPATLAGSQSLLLEASDSPTTGAVPFSGTVEWTKGTDEAGLPTLIGKVSIPERNLGVELLIRKNSDPSLPASHLMEVNFKVSESFIGGSIAGLPGVLLKNEELVQGTPLAGSSSRVVGNSFMFELSNKPNDFAHNVNMLMQRKWMDLALVYATGKRAIVTLQIDAAANQAFTEALLQWHPPIGNVSIVPRSKPTTPDSRYERVVTVRGEGFRETLLKNGFDETTFGMVSQSFSSVLATDRMPNGVRLRILMGPSRMSDDLIPHRLSVYYPANDGTFRHAATAALTDRGSYVLGLPPPPIEYLGATLGDPVSPPESSEGELGKSDRYGSGE